MTDALKDLQRLEVLQQHHAFWQCDLLAACKAGVLTLDDFRYLFGQYSLYSKNFTRFLAALMANLDNDLFRAHITENLWSESGGIEPEKRHAQIFRKFLHDGLGIDPDTIEYTDYTQHFVREFLVMCLRSTPVEAAAVLSLGTEGIVARMYTVFVEGLRKAGLPEEHLEFFRIHIECDDGHAFTLQQVMLSYCGDSGWYDSCLRGLESALALRQRFFDNIYRGLQDRRLHQIVGHIQGRKSLVVQGDPLVHDMAKPATPLYENQIDKHNIQFSVDRLPFRTDVLDPRILNIPAGKNNERHRHAHETLFYIVTGTGRVVVDDATVDVKPGDTVFVPRWAMHQTQNTGPTEMKILAVTDFGLTGKAYVGDYDKTARGHAAEGAPDIPAPRTGSGRIVRKMATMPPFGK